MDEREARINALHQLLANTQTDMIKALEGRMTIEAYETLRAARESWQNELATLEERPEDIHSGDPGIMEIATANAVATVDLEYRMIMMEMGV